MSSMLSFGEREILAGDFGVQADIPDIYGGGILQNNLIFNLSEEDEIFEGYGRRKNSFPYNHYLSYTRTLSPKKFKTAVLENQYIKAVFLPELGGRLWELYDKKTGKNLLYTNDVIRYSNLAICNAWFSGGVEWNIGIIGHTPFTCEPLYVAQLKDEDGNPVLRMYEYERIRGVEYQMDFWLGEHDSFLNCRMRIVNSTECVVPMYWWSNIAVPEFTGGRIIVPAQSAFSCDMHSVYKVSIPEVDGIDISFYNNIPSQVDYFFDIPRNVPKYIAHVDSHGYGLLHLSTERLRSRKLFCWGHNEGSDNWQHFLTQNAGPYVEIQGGLGKTQYGCIPMAPHTAWEWMEQYGSIDIGADKVTTPYRELRDYTTDMVRSIAQERDIEGVLQKQKKMALTKGTVIQKGSSGGALAVEARRVQTENQHAERGMTTVKPLSVHLDYTFTDEDSRLWSEFLTTGIAPTAPHSMPSVFVCDVTVYATLKKEIHRKENVQNWYAHYMLALLHFHYDCENEAYKEMEEALKISENPWTCHGYGSLLCLGDKADKEKALPWLLKGLTLRKDDIGYVKSVLRLLLVCEKYREIISVYESLPVTVAEEKRIMFDYMVALSKSGEEEKAKKLLKDDFVLDDLRECELGVSELWKSIHKDETIPIPPQWNFYSL